ncbi:MAG: hypothetical protein HYV15_07260 [Elusimicrobia bacterium]|nr:hypothetical protein [Elusimicrobiota bacterium]
MSFMGRVEGKCPDGCEAAEVEVWSFVRGDRDENLRLKLLGGELNLVVCDGCGKPFFPDAPLVYADPTAGLVAFVFPESYEADAPRWRKKMADDFAAMRDTLGPDMPLVAEPELFFGYGAIAAALQADDDREDEERVAEWLLKDLGLSYYRVDPSYARKRLLPRFVPLAGPKWTAEAARGGVDKLLKANDRLASFALWRPVIDAGEKPPAVRRAP